MEKPKVNPPIPNEVGTRAKKLEERVHEVLSGYPGFLDDEGIELTLTAGELRELWDVLFYVTEYLCTDEEHEQHADA